MATPINRCDKAVNTLHMHDVAVNTDAEEASSKRCSACCWKIPAVDDMNIISAEEFRDKSLDGLTNVCDKAVSVLRNTITSLGKVLKEQKFHPLQFKEVFAVPIQNLEVGKLKLENLLIDIRTQYHDIHFKDDRYFCNTYLKVRDLKDWGYRFVDYASATVALAMIVVEAAKAQNPQPEQSSMIQHWGITGGFLVLSKVLSAATDYRSKKTLEKEQRKNTLLHLKYRCEKAKEAAAIIDVLKAFTCSIDEIDPIELKTQFKRSIRAIKEVNGGVVSSSTAKELKKELGSLMEEKIFQDAGSAAVLQYKYEKRVLKKIFMAWNQQRFEIDETRGGADLSALGEGGHTIVEVTETGIVGDPRLKEVFREWNHRRAEADSAAGVRGFLPDDQSGRLKEEDRGGNGKEMEAVVVDMVPFDHEEGRNISANLQYGTGKEAEALTLPLSTSALAGQSNNPYLSPPNLFATMSRYLETTV
ncbi:MAG: hypothetical protein FJZ60_04340 [Chlamydiae bacterium]|nr:hypothetical protein [Chlamydiota bacterium]